jgi:hypothetical protein
MPSHGHRHRPRASGLADRAAAACADQRDFLQNLSCQLFDVIETLTRIEPSIGRQCGEPESDLGR